MKNAYGSYTSVSAGIISLDKRSEGALNLSESGVDYYTNGIERVSFKYSHIPGDSDWHSYVQLKAKPLPHKNHIAAMPGGHSFHRLVFDDETGYMGWE